LAGAAAVWLFVAALAAGSQEPAQGPALGGSVKRTDRSLVGMGEAMTYTLVISNAGPFKGVSVSARDVLPGGLILEAGGLQASSGVVTHTGWLTAATVMWTGSLPPAQAVTVTVPVSVATCQSPVVNTAVISDPYVLSEITLTVSTGEDFDQPEFPPPGWGISASVAAPTWQWAGADVSRTVQPLAGAGMAEFRAYDIITGSARLYSRRLTLPAGHRYTLQFWMYHELSYPEFPDAVWVQASTNDGVTYTHVTTAPFYRFDGSLGWKKHAVDLSDYAGSSVRIGLLGVSGYGNNIYVDGIDLLRPPAMADFDALPRLNRAAGHPITFSGTTLDSAMPFVEWDFGDGTTSQPGALVTHVYDAPGLYTVTMQVCGYAVYSRSLSILAAPGLKIDSSAPTPLSLATYFTAPLVAEVGPSAAVPTYTWDFGDGSPAEAGPGRVAVSHTYTAQGIYTVALSVAGSGEVVTLAAQTAVAPAVRLSLGRVQQDAQAVTRVPFTYTLAVANAGPSGATRVNLSQAITRAIFQSVSAPGGQPICTLSPALVEATCSLGALEMGATTLVTSVVIPGALGVMTVTAVAAANEADLDADRRTLVAPFAVSAIKRFVPAAGLRWPPLPDTPTLSPIDNLGWRGNYAVAWGAAISATEYLLQEDIRPAFNDPMDLFRGAQTSWLIFGKPAGVYYYRVRGINSAGEGGWSNIVSATVRAPGAPDLYPVVAGLGDGNFTVSWGDADWAASYLLQEDASPSFAAPVTAYSGSGTQWEASGKAQGAYYYRVLARNSVGDSPWSATRSFAVVHSPYNGAWTGLTSQGRPVAFTVVGGAVTFMRIDYVMASCGIQSLYYYGLPAYVQADAFSVMDSGATYAYRATGSFTSPNAAAGDLVVSRYDECAGTLAITWGAVKP
jgi:uncharacterized repeat protein (TIGR01451 family)